MPPPPPLILEEVDPNTIEPPFVPTELPPAIATDPPCTVDAPAFI